MTEKITLRKINKKTMGISKNFYEKREWSRGELVCGIDEVGRGCLAGPLVVAAVILYPNSNIRSIKDSKLLSQDELKSVCPKIIKNCWHGFGIINNSDIDKYNIWNSTLMAMRQAVINLLSICPKLPSIILVDALPLSLHGTFYQDIEIKHFPKGESLSKSIAAASIVAKVKRDSLMALYDNALPGYKFEKHKGYATKDHQSALSDNGYSILHRQSYLKKFNHLIDENYEEQTSIFCGSDSELT